MSDQREKILPCPFCGGANFGWKPGGIWCNNTQCAIYRKRVKPTAWNTRANEAKGTVKENLTVGEGEAVAPTVDDIEVGIAPIARIDFSPTIPRIVWFKKVSQKIGELDVYTRHVSLSEDARDAERLRFIAKEQCTLRIVDIPIPLSSDAETVWEVVDYYMAEPKERIIGTGSTPQEAIDAAMAEGREVGK